MPSLRCAVCDDRLEAGYEEALTIALATHLEEVHGQRVSLSELAPTVRGVMVGGNGLGSQIAVARIVAIVLGAFFLLVALGSGPGWLAFAALAGVVVLLLNVVEAAQH